MLVFSRQRNRSRRTNDVDVTTVSHRTRDARHRCFHDRVTAAFYEINRANWTDLSADRTDLRAVVVVVNRRDDVLVDDRHVRHVDVVHVDRRELVVLHEHSAMVVPGVQASIVAVPITVVITIVVSVMITVAVAGVVRRPTDVIVGVVERHAVRVPVVIV